jgi:hypothetical protein
MAATSIDNDWLREVGQAFGGDTDIHRLQMENFQVLRTQAPQRPQGVGGQQFPGAQQQLPVAQQQQQQQNLQVQLSRNQLEEAERQLQALQQRDAQRYISPTPPNPQFTRFAIAESDVETETRYRHLMEEHMGRRRSAPTPANVPAAATGGGARNPLPS